RIRQPVFRLDRDVAQPARVVSVWLGRLWSALQELAIACREGNRQVHAETVADPIQDVDIEEANLAVRRLTERPRGIVALISDVELVGIGELIRKLSLPLFGGQVRLVLETQTGLRKSYRLSALARGRTGKGKTGEAHDDHLKGAEFP